MRNSAYVRVQTDYSQVKFRLRPNSAYYYGRGTTVPLTVYIMKKIKETKEKNWILKSTDTNDSLIKIKEIADELGINPIIAKLLYNRGYTDTVSAKAFYKLLFLIALPECFIASASRTSPSRTFMPLM